MDSIAARATASERRAIVAHYERVTPLITANFAGVPLVFEKHPQGIGGPAVFSNRREWHDIPPEATRTLVHTTHTTQPYPVCDEKTILAYVKRHDASGVHSWTSTPGRPDAVRYARIQLKPDAGGTQHQLREAMILVRDILHAHRAEAIPLWEGRDAALFIPFADAPDYPSVRLWLHAIENEAIAQHPELIVGRHNKGEVRTIRRIEITVEHNAPGLHTRLPYSLTVATDLPMVTPFDWSEFDTLHNAHVKAENAEARLAQGDLFAQLTAKLAHQTFAAVTH
jgi:bifunctional non-homologous end joining protein LigD